MSHLYPQLIDLVFWYNNNVVQLAISDVVPSRLTDFGLAKMGLRGGPGWYPLVICYIANWKISIFHGKINYFDWAMFNSKLLVYWRVC